VAIIAAAGRASASRVSVRVRAFDGFLGTGCPVFSGLMIVRPLKRLDRLCYTELIAPHLHPPIKHGDRCCCPGSEMSKFTTDSGRVRSKIKLTQAITTPGNPVTRHVQSKAKH
jgi:hypothetical protein